jgi:hypothetical protein
MSRTTGLYLHRFSESYRQKIFIEKGVFPPELVGKYEPAFDFVMDYLEARNVVWNKKEYLRVSRRNAKEAKPGRPYFLSQLRRFA